MPEEIATKEKSFDWVRVILVVVSGLILLAASAYAGYWYGTQSAKIKTQTSKPSPVSQSNPTSSAGDGTKDWKIYEDPLGEYLFSYPAEWSQVSQCKFGDLCMGSPDFKEKLIPGRVAGGRFVVDQGRVFSVSRNDAAPQMALEEACSPGGPLYVRSCEATVLDNNPAMRRVEGNPENGTTIIVLRGNYIYLVGMSHAPNDREATRLLDQILSTFKFLD